MLMHVSPCRTLASSRHQKKAFLVRLNNPNDGVERLEQWRQKFKIIVYATIFLLGIFVIGGGGSRIFKEWKVRLNQELQYIAQQMYLPNLTQAQTREGMNPKEWIAKSAMRLLPLGQYVQANEGLENEVEDEATAEMILRAQAKDEHEVDANGNLVGGENTQAKLDAALPSGGGADTSLENLKDFDYLLSHFYTVDSTTMIGPEQLDAESLVNENMKITPSSGGYKVLIFHTHSQETFADSVEGDPSTSIVGIGEYLTQRLNEKGISTLHDTGVYDLINGKLDRSKAYEFSEEGVRPILASNPEIEVVIDLHRDGVGNDTHLVTEVDGKPTAKIMFFNGLSRTRSNGDLTSLPNPYIQDNLAFSLQMQLAAENSYPGFARHIYLKGYRYSLHMMPKSLLIEAGAQTNTVEEMKNAMDVLSNLLYQVLAG